MSHAVAPQLASVSAKCRRPLRTVDVNGMLGDAFRNLDKLPVP